MARFGNPLQRAARIEAILERQPLDDAQHFVAPSKRELRTQAVHRLQVGILGLAAILLLIGLASAIMQHARLTEDPAAFAGSGRGAPPRTTGIPGDPLADMGVAPEMRAGRTPGAIASPARPGVAPDPARSSRTN